MILNEPKTWPAQAIPSPGWHWNSDWHHKTKFERHFLFIHKTTDPTRTLLFFFQKNQNLFPPWLRILFSVSFIWLENECTFRFRMNHSLRFLRPTFLIIAILWLAILIFIAWPIAGIAAAIWVFLQPFESCFSFLKSLQNFLEKLVTWPRDLGHAISNCQSSFPAPF